MTNTVLLKRSATPGSAPSAGNLSLGELAINYNDGNLYYKNNSNVVTVIASNQFVSVSGNITGGNLLTGGLISAAGNIVGGNIVTSGATGNITGANVISATTLSATGNAIAGNVTTTGNVTGNYFIGNGSQLTGIATAISGNLAGNLVGNGYGALDFAFVSAIGNVIGGNVLTAGQISSTGNLTSGNIITSGLISAIGNATAGNIATAGLISATGNILGGNLVTSGAILANGIISATGNITAGNVNTGGQISATGTVTVGNLVSNGLITATGNISAGNLVSLGVLSVTGATESSIAGNLSMNSQYIVNLANPVNAQDAATKYYVDSVAEGLHIHQSCFVATTSNLATATSGTITYDNGNAGVGATLTTTGTYLLIDSANVQTVGTRILVKNEANAAHNGIYTYSNATVIIRATDFNTATEIASGDFTFVSSGNVYANTGWVQTNTVTTVGTDPIAWTQFSGAGTYEAGTGLTLSNNVFSVNASQTQITAVGNLSLLSVVGNVDAGNIRTAGIVSATGNITGNYFIGNGSQLTGIVTAISGNLAGNLVGNGYGALDFAFVSAIGNVSAGGITTNGAVSAQGNVLAAAFYDSGNTSFFIDPANTGTAGNFNGTVNAVIFNTTSDARLKENIKSIDSALTKVLSIDGITYNFRSDELKVRHAGVTAQQLLTVFPEAVSGTEQETYRVSYGDLVALLIEAIKDQQQQIDSLKKIVGTDLPTKKGHRGNKNST